MRPAATPAFAATPSPTDGRQLQQQTASKVQVQPIASGQSDGEESESDVEEISPPPAADVAAADATKEAVSGEWCVLDDLHAPYDDEMVAALRCSHRVCLSRLSASAQRKYKRSLERTLMRTQPLRKFFKMDAASSSSHVTAAAPTAAAASFSAAVAAAAAHESIDLAAEEDQTSSSDSEADFSMEPLASVAPNTPLAVAHKKQQQPKAKARSKKVAPAAPAAAASTAVTGKRKQPAAVAAASKPCAAKPKVKPINVDSRESSDSSGNGSSSLSEEESRSQPVTKRARTSLSGKASANPVAAAKPIGGKKVHVKRPVAAPAKKPRVAVAAARVVKVKVKAAGSAPASSSHKRALPHPGAPGKRVVALKMKPPPSLSHSSEDDALLAELVANAEAKRASSALITAAAAGSQPVAVSAASESNFGFIDESPLPPSPTSSASLLPVASTHSEPVMGLVSDDESPPTSQPEPATGLVSDDEPEESVAEPAMTVAAMRVDTREAGVASASSIDEKQATGDEDQAATHASKAEEAADAKLNSLVSSSMEATESSADREMSNAMSELDSAAHQQPLSPFKLVELVPTDADALMLPPPSASLVPAASISVAAVAAAPEPTVSTDVSVTCDSMSWFEWATGLFTGGLRRS